LSQSGGKNGKGRTRKSSNNRKSRKNREGNQRKSIPEDRQPIKSRRGKKKRGVKQISKKKKRGRGKKKVWRINVIGALPGERPEKEGSTDYQKVGARKGTGVKRNCVPEGGKTWQQRESSEPNIRIGTGEAGRGGGPRDVTGKTGKNRRSKTQGSSVGQWDGQPQF